MSGAGISIPVDIPSKTEEKLLTEFFSIAGVMSSLLALGLVSLFEKLKNRVPVYIPGVGTIPGIA